jgi:ABC-type transport system involved in multi-copper enzyme maturation permease subunit
MKLGGIFRFELAYQLRRPQTWLFFAAPAAATFLFIRDSAVSDAVRDDFWINSPSAVAGATLIGCLLWLLIAPSIAGEAAARDVETRMDPLAYTVPVTKAEYLGGRFLAAFAINAMVLLAATLGSLIAAYAPGIKDAAIGPFRIAAYLTAFAYLALPNAIVATAIQFSLAALGRRTRAAYLGSVILFFTAYIISSVVYWFVGRPDIARMIDPIGVITITEVLPDWTPLEKRTRLLELAGPLLWNRIIWLAIALGALVFTHYRFRFVHHAASSWWNRFRGKLSALAPAPANAVIARGAISIPQATRTYGPGTRVRQTMALTFASFRAIATSWVGVALLVVIPVFAFLLVPVEMEQLDVPLLPRTVKILEQMTAPVTGILTPWLIVPLLILFYAGELVWRERDAGMGEAVDATPVPESVLFAGKFLGLGLVLVAFVSLMALAGILIQVTRGYDDLQIGLYLKVLLGLQLAEYILFAVLAVAVHVVVNNKHVGHLVALLLFASLIFASSFGIQHNLLIFGASPAWWYTEMRGFGGSIGPWLWFKLYWAAWALLIALVVRLLWVRGWERGVSARLALARRRLTQATARVAGAAIALTWARGGVRFCDTKVLND